MLRTSSTKVLKTRELENILLYDREDNWGALLSNDATQLFSQQNLAAASPTMPVFWHQEIGRNSHLSPLSAGDFYSE